MQALIRIGDDLYPPTGIESVVFAPCGGYFCASVMLRGIRGTFDYYGDYITVLRQALVDSGVFLVVGTEVIPTGDIEWVSLRADCGDGRTGVRLRVATDARGAGDEPDRLRTWVGQDALDAREQLLRMVTAGGTLDNNAAAGY